MPYIGQDLQVAYPTYKILDNISSSFNGSSTSFPLLVGGVAPVPAPINEQQLLISVGGVIQQPDPTGVNGFKLSAGNIVFSSAPTTGEAFFGVILAGADYVNAGGNFPSGSSSAPSVTFDSSTGTGLYLASANTLGFATSGAQAATLDSSGNYLTSGSITGTALIPSGSSAPTNGVYLPSANTVAISTGGSGRLFVDANGNIGAGTSTPANYAGFVTLALADSSGAEIDFIKGSTVQGSFYNAGDIFYIESKSTVPTAFVTNGSERLRIDSSGRVGIGTTSPTTALDVTNALEPLSFQSTTASRNYIIHKHNSSGDIAYLGAGGAALSAGTATDYAIRANQGALLFATNGNNERARIDSSGRLLVGTSSALTGSNSQYSKIVSLGNSLNSGGSYVAFGLGQVGTSLGAGSDVATINFTDNAAGQFASIACFTDAACGAGDYPGRLVFSTTADGASSPTERARINSSGFFKASNNGSYVNPGSSGTYHEFSNNINDAVLLARSTYGTGYASYIIYADFNHTPNNATAYFLYFGDTSGKRMDVRSNGGIANYQANNVNLSDRNTKKDISPAADTWSCIKEWEIVNYRYKDQPDDADLNLGVIAQQVAESCPEVITVFEEAKDDQPEKLGIKEQQMYWMAIKALQEAQVRIEQLEATNADLLARVTALESA